MAIAPTVLTSGGSDTDASTYTTASITPTVGRLVLAAIQFLDLGSAKSGPFTCTGCGVTWTAVNDVGGGATEPALGVFRAYADPALVTTGTLTFGGLVTVGQTADGAVWMVVEVAGVNPLTTNGVVQSAVASTSTDSVSATLAAFGNVANGTVGIVAGYDNAGGALDITEGSGFTMLAELSQAAGGDTLRIGWEYKTTNDTGVDATISAANDRLLIVAMEIAGTVPTYPLTVSGAFTPAAALVRQTNKVLAGGLTPTSTLVRVTAKLVAGALTPVGALAKLIARSIGGSLTPTSILVRLVNKLTGGTVTPAGTIARQVNTAYSGQVGFNGDPNLEVQTAFAGTITPTSTLAKVLATALGGLLTPTGALTRQANKVFSGNVAPTGVIARVVNKIIGGVLTLVGDLTTDAPPSPDPNPITLTIQDTGHTGSARDHGHLVTVADSGHTATRRDRGHTVSYHDTGHTATVREGR